MEVLFELHSENFDMDNTHIFDIPIDVYNFVVLYRVLFVLSVW